MFQKLRCRFVNESNLVTDILNVSLTIGEFRLDFWVMKLMARPGYAPTKVSPKPLTICFLHEKRMMIIFDLMGMEERLKVGDKSDLCVNFCCIP